MAQTHHHQIIDEVSIPPVSWAWEFDRGSFAEVEGVKADKTISVNRVRGALDQIAKQCGMRLLWDAQPWEVTIRATWDASPLIRYDIKVPREVDDEAMAVYQKHVEVMRAEARQTEITALALILQSHMQGVGWHDRAQMAAEAVIDAGYHKR